MLCEVIVCLLITYQFELVECKAWPDQFNRYDYSDPSQQNWGNPYYHGDVGTRNFGLDPSSTSTTKPLYPTLFPHYQPSAPVPEPGRFPPPGTHPFNNQRQVPTNPFDVVPIQPNIGGNRNFNHSLPNNSNDYSNNNFNYPFDNTRTTFPPFDGTTRRPTFPTRRVFGNIPSSPPPFGTLNNTNQRPFNPAYPLNPSNPTKPTIPPYYNNQNNQNNRNNQNYDPTRNDRYNPNQWNFGPNYNNNGTSPFRPFTNPSQINQPGNPYQNQPNYPSNSNGQIGNGNQLSGGNQFNNGNQYPNQPNIGGQNQGIRPNGNSFQSNQNSFNQPSHSPSYQKPDYDPNGVALAPFPDVSSFPNNHGDYRPPINMQPGINGQFNSNGPSKTPLAGYTGAHVPLGFEIKIE